MGLVSVARAASTAICFLSAGAWAAVPLADSVDGVTCYHYAAGFGLNWQQKGGDWLDSKGKPSGDEPYATAQIAVKSGRQQLQLDLTPLAKSWLGGAEPKGTVFLRALPGAKSALADFASRENPDPAAHPVLRVVWGDGQSVAIEPVADTHLDCSTVNSLGKRPLLQIGHGIPAILAFPFQPRSDVTIKSATLVMTSDKQYGGGAVTIGAYQPMLPWAHAPAKEDGLAASFVRDRKIAEHPDVIFTDQFESHRLSDEWTDVDSTGDSQLVNRNSAERFESLDGKALQVTVRKGKTQGLNMHYRFARSNGSEPEEVFFRYYLRFGDGWDPSVDGGKMPGLSGTYNRAGWGGRKSDGTNGWAARGSFYRIPRELGELAHLRGIGSYLYHVDMADAYGDHRGWSLGPSGALEKNRWYSVEQQVRMNRPGERDGILRAWIDGQLVFEKTDMRYRSVPDLRIESAWMNVYHGGTQPTNKDLTLFIDNVVIAKKYIGPAKMQ